MRHTTLMLLKKDGKLLLGLKKRGFGLGKINGIGGKVEEGESVEAAAVRETFEEIGVNVSEMEHMADIVFDNLYYKGVPESHMMHIFIGTKWSGKLIETDEIKPQWFNISDLPYDRMWIDDTHWLPEVLRGNKVEAWFHFNEKDVFTDFWVKKLSEECVSRITDENVGQNNTGEDPSTFEEKEGARAILMNEKGQIALIHAVNKGWYKLPGGGRDKDELVHQCLERELLEETGYSSDSWLYLGGTWESTSKLTNTMHLFLAKDCVKVSKQHLDQNEHLEVVKVPLQDAVAMVMNGSINANSSAHLILKVARMMNIM